MADITMEDLSKKLADLETKLTKAQETLAQKEEELVVAKLSPEDREIYDAMPTTDQETFRKSDDTAREAMLEEAREAVAKANELPEPVRKQMEDIQKRLHEAEARAQAAEAVAKKAEDERHLAELSKVADAEYAGLPGTSIEKAAVLKSLEKLSEDEREAVYKLLRAGNSCLAGQMKPVGKSTPESSGAGAWERIEKKAAEIVSKSGGKMSLAEAVSQVTVENPELYSEYLAEKA